MSLWFSFIINIPQLGSIIIALLDSLFINGALFPPKNLVLSGACSLTTETKISLK